MLQCRICLSFCQATYSEIVRGGGIFSEFQTPEEYDQICDKTQREELVTGSTVLFMPEQDPAKNECPHLRNPFPS